MQAVRTCKAKSSPPHGAPARGVSQPPVASSFFEESRCEEQEREAQPSNAASSLVFATKAPSKIASHLRSRFAAEQQQQVSFCLILRWLRRCLYATKGHLTEPALASTVNSVLNSTIIWAFLCFVGDPITRPLLNPC